MSFLDSWIQKVSESDFAKGIRKSVGSETSEKIVDVTNNILTVLTSPIGAITNFTKAKEVTKNSSALNLVAQGAENALLVTAPFSAAGKSLATSAAKAAFSTPAKAATTLVVGGAVASSSTIRETAINLVTPSNIIGTGEKVGDIVDNLPEKVQDTGIVKGVLATAAGLGVGGLIVAGGKALYDDIKDGGLFDSDEKTTQNNQLPKETTMEGNALSPTSPITPQTTTITKGEGKKSTRRRQSVKQQPINVSQRVNVMVNNKTAKFIKRVHYA